MVKRLQRVTPKQTPEQSDKPSSLPNVKEQIPGWLKTVLGKYGESEGRLVGLETDFSEEEHIGPPPPTTEEEGQLSNLLEQMAETGIDPAAGQGAFSSVEWGAPPPAAQASARPLDDLLSHLSVEPEDDDDYEEQSYPAEPAQPSTQELPDWLTDTTPAAEPTQGYRQPVPDTPPAPAGDNDVPDWLADALDAPAQPPSQPRTPTPPPDSSISDNDVPDWLTDALDKPASIAQPEQGSAPASANKDTLDWSGSDDISAYAPAETAPGDEGGDWQVPDWITEGMDDIFAANPTQEIPSTETGTTGWFANAQLPPAEDTPDWLVDDAPPTTETAPPKTAVPDWLAEPETSTRSDLGDNITPGEEALDWLFDTSDMPELTEETDYVGQPAQLFPAEPTPPQIEAPPWLGNIQADSIPFAPPPETPGWLQNLEMPDTPAAPAANEPPVWLDKLQQEPGAAAALDEATEDTPSRIKRIKPLPRLQPKDMRPAEAESFEPPELAGDNLVPHAAEISQIEQPSPPEWADELAPAETADTSLPQWNEELAHLDTQEGDSTFFTAAEPEEEQDTTDWMSDLRAGVIDQELPPLPSTDQAAPDIDIPDWFAEQRPAETSETTAPDIDLDLPDWLVEQAPTQEFPAAGNLPEPVTDINIPDWLAEQRPAETGETTAPDIDLDLPDWLVEQAPTQEFPAAGNLPEPAPDTGIPDWLAEQRPAETDETTAPDIDLDLPDWLAEPAFTEKTPAEPPLENEDQPHPIIESELPDWMSELSEPAAPPPTVEPFAPIPDWLSAPATGDEMEEIQLPPENETTAPRVDIPDWLSEFPEAEPEQPDTVFAELETIEPAADIPDWLAELPEADSVPEPIVTDFSADIPDWLAEESPAPETAKPTAETTSPAIEIDEPGAADAGLPDWLSELPEIEIEQPAAGEPIVDMPDWLFEQTTDEESLIPPTDSEREAAWEVEPTAAIPAWLAQQAPADEAAAEPKEEPDMPDWLSELPQIEQEQAPDVDLTELTAAIPAWLAQQAPADEVAAETEEEPDMPDWLANLSQEEPGQPDEDSFPTWEIPDIEPETSIDFAIEEPKPNTSQLFHEEFESSEPPLPPWLATGDDDIDSTATESAPTKQSPIQPAGRETGFTGLLRRIANDNVESSTGTGSSAKDNPTAADKPSAGLDEDSQLPDWLASTEDIPDDDESSGSDWLSGLREATQAVEQALPPEDEDFPPPSTAQPDEEKKTNLDEPEASLASLPPDSGPTTPPPAEKSAGWMQALKPFGHAEAVLDTNDTPSAESTGMLAGLTGLLPAEKISAITPALTPKTTNGNGADAVLEAAQSFYAIATQAPQPSALPAPIAQPEEKQFPKNLARAGIFLLFILLVAIPLLPGFQKAADPETGRQAPWTEPGGELSDVLSGRRSQLIGNELGLIDLQQPDSVALVSFDYSTGTQGEMQPLAEAILGRLRGQGMRVIVMSLEPEGAALAQTVLNQRDEPYGENVVNLGYMPGQMMAVRALASGQKHLSTIADYQQGLTFSSDKRTNWQDVETLQQVNVIVTLADNPATARWWIEQMQMAAPPNSEQYLLGATSAVAEPFLQPYRSAGQLDGLIAGINGAAAIEAGRRQFGPARQMLDSQSLAHLLIIILIAAGTIAGWMPKLSAESYPESEEE